MKKKFGLSISTSGFGLLLLTIPVSAAAHSGGLDSMGCHNNKKTGKYQCHRGPLAGKSFSSKDEAVKALEKQKLQANGKKAQTNAKK